MPTCPGSPRHLTMPRFRETAPSPRRGGRVRRGVGPMQRACGDPTPAGSPLIRRSRRHDADRASCFYKVAYLTPHPPTHRLVALGHGLCLSGLPCGTPRSPLRSSLFRRVGARSPRAALLEKWARRPRGRFAKPRVSGGTPRVLPGCPGETAGLPREGEGRRRAGERPFFSQEVHHEEARVGPRPRPRGDGNRM